MSQRDPNADGEVLSGGTPLDEAVAIAIAIHGRGATAQSILQLVAQADRSDGDIAYLAPQATRATWYPRSFLAPPEHNQPYLDSALSTVERVMQMALGQVSADRVAIVGFSQGGCLASEFVARNPRRYGGLFAFSGGLIGDEVDTDRYAGSLDGSPVYLGCSDIDPHIPVERVHETADVFEMLDGEVTTDIFPGMGHTVNADELEQLSKRFEQLTA